MAKVRKSGSRAKAPTTRVASRRETGGAGFDFEDRVSAWFLLQTLAGRPLPGVGGGATRIQMQTASLGWLLDDVLVSTGEAGSGRRLAVSCKANLQVSASGLPDDFMESAWRQWLGSNGNPMTRGRDALMLATRGRLPAFDATWSELKTFAAGPDDGLAVAQAIASPKSGKVFERLKAAAGAAGLAVTGSDVVSLIRAIEVRPFDFQLANSQDEIDAIASARSLLAANTLEGGTALWDELIGRAREARLGSGALDFGELLRDLRRRHELRDHPDFETAWGRLEALTKDAEQVIEGALPSGEVLPRADAQRLTDLLEAGPVCLVHGDSGIGKSALVKSVLDEHFGDVRRVWLKPEDLERALAEATRRAIGLPAPLLDVLLASARPANVLVIDAVEHIGAETVLRAQILIRELVRRNVKGEPSAWRIVLVGQPDAFVNGRFQEILKLPDATRLEVRELSAAEVRHALLPTPALTWLASDNEAVAALGNLRTLGWVVAAAGQFQPGTTGGGVSAVAIADALWRFWTDGKLPVQRLLMRFAERDGEFEHSFAISRLSGDEAAALDGRPHSCPVRVNAANRVEFEHDLAADWARFQRLKEMAEDVETWVVFASNPLWNNALRMFGQWLLRESANGRSRWDAAFEVAEKLGEKAPLAGDILLDALFLDPSGEGFLNERAGMLFADDGKRLHRLLRRFEHVATISGVRGDAREAFGDLTLYLQAQFRTPVIGRWPAMVRFLTAHQDRVAQLRFRAVSSVCERWLMGIPSHLLGGSPVPFRKELADLALSTARAVQLDLAKGVGYLGDEFKQIHQAAFAGAPDLPDRVAAWALEMVRRAPLDPDIAAKVQEHRKRQADEHKARLESDPTYRERDRQRKSLSVSLSSRRKLPPWPLGAKGRVDRYFREAVLRSATFQAFVQAAPAAAGEVLLACIIDDAPEEDYGQNRFGPDLGLAHDHESQPSVFWKSQFYRFLQTHRDPALSCLQQLVGFCTDRWEREITRDGASAPDPIVLRFPDGTERAYRGGRAVFLWPSRNWHGSGQLASALDALERWLCDLLDRGEDIVPLVEDILRRFDSASILGVLTNVGKYRPDLFAGPLKALLAVHRIYLGDHQRVEESGFQGMSWSSQGELAFDMAKTWALAPHRKATLFQVASALLLRDADIAAFLQEATSSWPAPNDPKAALEFRILKATLDRRNYHQTTDPQTGEEAFRLAYPEDLVEAINVFHRGGSRVRQALTLPTQVRDLLAGERPLDDAEAEHLAGFLAAAAGAEDIDLEEGMLRPAQVAAAVALTLRAAAWLEVHADVAARARAVIDRAMADVGDDADASCFRFPTNESYLQFVAHLAMARWLSVPSPQADEDVLRLMTSGDAAAGSVIAWLAYSNREGLGSRFWRMQFLALLWAGLQLLHPGAGDDDAAERRWRRWRRWLVTRSLTDAAATSKLIQPLAVAKRVERFEIERWRRRRAEYGDEFKHRPGRRLWGGMSTYALKISFGWLLDHDATRRSPASEFEMRKELVQAFWAWEAWCRTGSVDEDDDDDFKPPDQAVGYPVIAELARLTLASPIDEAPALWEPVFVLGKRGHYCVDHFLTSWLLLVNEATDTDEFVRRWRPMIAYMLDRPEWSSGRYWFRGQQLQRQALGFHASTVIARNPGVIAGIAGMKDLYERWAEKQLSGDDGNLEGFCGFLSSAAGAPLRLDGLRWIASAIQASPEGRRRDRSSSDSLVGFLDVLAEQHLDEISKSPDARAELLQLVAYVVARQLPAALVLQEKIAGAL